MNRVVITGMGVVSANAHGLKNFETALRNGTSGIRFFPKLKELGFGCQVGGIPQGLDEIQKSYFTKETLLAMNSSMTYAAIAGIDAWRDAGFTYDPENPPAIDWNTGAVMGTGVGGVDTLCEFVVPRVNEGKIRRLGSTSVEQTMSSAVSARLGGLLGLGGQVTTNSSACTTGTEAIVNAYLHIREGRSKRMLAGGAEGSSHYIWAGFDAMRVLSRAFNATPEKASRPMSASAAGFVPSSGAGVLMLESLESALERGARIYAEIIGGQVNCGGQRGGGSMTAPNPEGVVRCIRTAMTEARLASKDIDLINGHLTATMADPLEISNWQRSLELRTEEFPLIQSTKSMIGHSLGAAGGIECVASVLQISQDFVHGSVNCEDLLPELQPFAKSIPQKTLEKKIKVIAKASFGFGDVNGCILFRNYQ